MMILGSIFVTLGLIWRRVCYIAIMRIRERDIFGQPHAVTYDKIPHAPPIDCKSLGFVDIML